MNTYKKNTYDILQNTYCRLKPSKISGVGVFAVRDIPKDMVLFKGQRNEKWHKFKMEELKNLDNEILKMIDDFFVIEKNKTVSIPKSGLNGIDISFFVNNSDNFNARTIDNGFTFSSIRKIKKGEEITVAYSDYDYKYKKDNNFNKKIAPNNVLLSQNKNF